MKKKMIVLIVFVMLFSFSITSVAGSRTITLSNSYACELDHQYIAAGSYRGKISVNSISNYPSSVTPQLFMVMYGPGFTIVSRTFTSAGAKRSPYSLAGPTYIGVQAERYSSGTVTADVSWLYND